MQSPYFEPEQLKKKTTASAFSRGLLVILRIMRFAKLTKRIASAMIVDSDLINIRTQISSRLHAWNMANHDWYKNRKVGTDLHSFKFFQNLCCFSRNLFPNLQNIKRKGKAEKGCFLWVSNPWTLVLRWERIEGSWAVLGYIGGRSSWPIGVKVVMWCFHVTSRRPGWCT